MHKVWGAIIFAADSVDQIYFPRKPASTGITTNDIANSWGPLDWLRFYPDSNNAMTVRVYVRGCPNWYDDSAFLDDYDQQYLEMEIPSSTARASVTTVVGEIWGWNIVDAPTTSVSLYGGTGPVPPR